MLDITSRNRAGNISHLLGLQLSSLKAVSCIIYYFFLADHIIEYTNIRLDSEMEVCVEMNLKAYPCGTSVYLFVLPVGQLFT